MATPGKRPRIEAEHVTKSGFLHNVSPLKTGGIGQHKYFTAEMQLDKDSFQKVVSFNSGVHAKFMEAAKQKSPVKLSNCDVTPNLINGNLLDIKFTARSLFGYNERPSFTCRAPVTESVPEQAALTCTINELQNLTSSQKANISAKVISVIILKEEVPTRYGVRSFRKVLLGDKTGTVSCCLWEDKMESVDIGKSYMFENITMNEFKGTRYASTIQTTQVTEIPDLNVKAEDCYKLVKTSINSVEVTKMEKCPTCRTRITISPEQLTVKCTKCQKRTLARSLILDMTCTLSITVDKNFREVKIPSMMLNQLLQSLDCKGENPDEIEETLLLAGDFEMSLHEDEIMFIKHV